MAALLVMWRLESTFFGGRGGHSCETACEKRTQCHVSWLPCEARMIAEPVGTQCDCVFAGSFKLRGAKGLVKCLGAWDHFSTVANNPRKKSDTPVLAVGLHQGARKGLAWCCRANKKPCERQDTLKRLSGATAVHTTGYRSDTHSPPDFLFHLLKFCGWIEALSSAGWGLAA